MTTTELKINTPNLCTSGSFNCLDKMLKEKIKMLNKDKT